MLIGSAARSKSNGRPGQWTSDDLEAARCPANLFGRPRGSQDLAPQERWDARGPVSLSERATFLVPCRRARLRVTLLCCGEQISADPADAATIERAAVSTVIADLQYLKFRRERVPA